MTTNATTAEDRLAATLYGHGGHVWSVTFSPDGKTRFGKLGRNNHPDQTAERRSSDAGRAVPEELKEPEFDLLRKRDDFQKLQKEVEAKASNHAKPDKQPQPNKK
jgi:hypothetical protein